MDKQSVVFTYIEHHLVLKTAEILKHTAVWTDLEGVTVRGVSWSQKDTCCRILLREPQRTPIQRQEVDGGFLGLGDGKWDLSFKRQRVSVLQTEKSSRRNVGDDCITM